MERIYVTPSLEKRLVARHTRRDTFPETILGLIKDRCAILPTQEVIFTRLRVEDTIGILPEWRDVCIMYDVWPLSHG